MPTVSICFAPKSASGARLSRDRLSLLHVASPGTTGLRREDPLAKGLRHVAEMELVVGSSLHEPLHGQLGLPLNMAAGSQSKHSMEKKV